MGNHAPGVGGAAAPNASRCPHARTAALKVVLVGLDQAQNSFDGVCAWALSCELGGPYVCACADVEHADWIACGWGLSTACRKGVGATCRATNLGLFGVSTLGHVYLCAD